VNTNEQLVARFRDARAVLEGRRRHVVAAILLLREGTETTPKRFAEMTPMAQRWALAQAQSADRMSRSILRKSP